MASDNIVPFQPIETAEPRVWTCGHCGCENFRLYEDGSTECVLCEFRDEDQRGGWAGKVKPAADTTVNTLATREVVPYGTADFAKAAVLKSIDEDSVAIAVLWPNGRIKAWSIFSSADTTPRKQWLANTLAAVADLITGVPIETDKLPSNEE